ncbi:MAG: response regulator transcription factor [Roseivirga sp.]
MYKVIIIDDHELVAQGISNLFHALTECELVGTYNDPREALTKIEMLKPDLVVTDLDMPGINGLELCERLKKNSHVPRFILLTMHLDRNTAKKAIQLSIEGYMLKNADVSEFHYCVRTVLAGRNYFTPKVMEALADKGSEVKSTGLKKVQLLTDREIEILKLVVAGHSTKEISEKLFIARRTTETHRKSIMTKLEVNNVAGMVRIAMQEGLVE